MEQIITEQGPYQNQDHGYIAAISVTSSPEEVGAVCQDKKNVEKILSSLPDTLENFFDLELESSTPERTVYRNRNTLAAGTLTISFQKDEFHPGTVIAVDAKLEKIHFREEGPSTLMNIFLKRLKNLIETGEIPTTRGQPSGREELKPTHH